MCEGKDSSTMDRFAEWLVERGGDPANIAAVSCDMGLAYPAGCRRNFPKATIIFDKFQCDRRRTNEGLSERTSPSVWGDPIPTCVG